MPITKLSSQEFDQDTSRAKEAAGKSPVFITDGGRPAYVFLTIEEYRRLAGGKLSLADALAQPGDDADFAFDPPRIEVKIRPADLD